MTRILDPLLTMEPVVRVGRAAWDQGLLPRDEYTARLAAVQAVAGRVDLGALIIFGHATRSECLTYLTNFIPSARWGALVVVPGAEPALLAGLGGAREERYQRTVTWVRDLIHAPLSGATLRQALADRGAPAGRIGVVGLQQLLPADRVADIEAGLSQWQLVPVDAEMAALWRAPGPRARAAVAATEQILRLARQHAMHAFGNCGSPSRAAAAADRVARMSGCRDVRILIGAGDGSLRPYEGVRADTGTPVLTCYLAAERLGYWAEIGFSYPLAGLADRVLDGHALLAVADQARPGARYGQLAAAFDGGDLHVRGLGLSIAELPDQASGWDELRAGDVVSLLTVRRPDAGIVLGGSVLVVTEHGGAPLRAWPQ